MSDMIKLLISGYVVEKNDDRIIVRCKQNHRTYDVSVSGYTLGPEIGDRYSAKITLLGASKEMRGKIE